jgi:hypothetical protein
MKRQSQAAVGFFFRWHHVDMHTSFHLLFIIIMIIYIFLDYQLCVM